MTLSKYGQCESQVAIVRNTVACEQVLSFFNRGFKQQRFWATHEPWFWSNFRANCLYKSKENLVASRYLKREKGSLPVNVRRSKTSLLRLPYMASEASCVRTRERAAKPLSLPSPFAGCYRVTSRDSPKWRACSQAWPTAKTHSYTLAIAKTTMPIIGCDYSCSSSITMPRGTLREAVSD